MTAQLNYQTTGWTEATKNQFHPGDVISAINLKYTVFSPNHGIGMTELVCHVFDANRGMCQRHIDRSGIIYGFEANVLPRAMACKAYLREKFPELAKFSDTWDPASLRTQAELIKKVEEVFGKTVTVEPMKNKNPKDIEKYRNEIFDEKRKNGRAVIFLENGKLTTLPPKQKEEGKDD